MATKGTGMARMTGGARPKSSAYRHGRAARKAARLLGPRALPAALLAALLLLLALPGASALAASARVAPAAPGAQSAFGTSALQDVAAPAGLIALNETPKAPRVTKQPVSVTVEEGQSAVFESTATGVPAPTLQWELSTNGGTTWSAVAGGTT